MLSLPSLMFDHVVYLTDSLHKQMVVWKQITVAGVCVGETDCTENNVIL